MVLKTQSFSGYYDTSFLATFSVNDLTPTDPIVFDANRLNPGGHYDNTTGIYTVPLDGIYQVIFHILSYDDANIYPRLVVDGNLVMSFLYLHQFWFLNPQIVTLKLVLNNKFISINFIQIQIDSTR